MIGISVYLNDLNKEYVSTCVDEGVKYIFTSFKVQEENIGNLKQEREWLIDYCTANNVELIVDIDEKTLLKLGLDDYQQLAALGIRNLRIDGGIAAREVAELSQTFMLFLNASDITENELNQLQQYRVDLENCVAMHNFYPMPDSGLSQEYFCTKNRMFASYGMEVMAFISGDEKLRGPLYNGLPTLEQHRGVRPFVSYLSMKALGVNYIFIGDNQISSHERANILREDMIVLHATFFDKQLNIQNQKLELRKDHNDAMIRIADRSLVATQPNGYVLNMQKGDITIENKSAPKRYQGEIQIRKKSEKSMSSKTVIGHLHPYDIPLLDYISGDIKIAFGNYED